MESSTKILTKARDLFYRLGIRSIGMDYLARELGMSKKTIYQHFSSKDDIVRNVITDHLADEKAFIEQKLQNKEKNAIDEMIEIIEHALTNMRGIHPSTLFDLQKYHSDSWDLFVQFKEEFIYNCIRENIERGKKQKMYRDAIDAGIISRIYINTLDFLVNPMHFPATIYNMSELYLEYIHYHMRGIVSQEGLTYLNEKKLKKENA